MRRLPIVVSFAALVVAVLGSTSLGEAAGTAAKAGLVKATGAGPSAAHAGSPSRRGPRGPRGKRGPPGPAGPATAAGLVSVKSAPFSLGPNAVGDFTVSCDAGQKAIAGGYDNPVGAALAFDTRPSPDGGSWKIFLSASSSGASGTIFAVCLR